ncbi:MAG: hypothetical protein ACP5RD_03985 [bacterium]
MKFVKNKENIKKILVIFIILTIFSLLIINLIKLINSENNKDYNNFNKISKNNVDVVLVTYQNEIVNKDNVQEIYDFILKLKNNKNFHYEFKRQIEKRNFINIIVNQEEFSSIFLDKNKYFDKNIIDLIEKEFGSFDNFVNLFYYFYISLFFAQIDSKIPDLIKYKESLEDKLYKIKPKILQELKEKLNKTNDINERQKIEELLSELSKNNYKNLTKNQIKVLQEKIDEVQKLIDLYNNIKNKDYYKWVLENKEKILQELKY